MLDNMIHDTCGVFAIFNHSKAAELAYFGIHALQHRGQESAGIVTVENGKFLLHRGMGEVSDVFSDRSIVERLTGKMALGHTRYSTSGASSIINRTFIYISLL